MCALGGGNNRCLHHNPISKFVVKVVTVRAKAPEQLVNSTLVELSKEGKKLPAPAPEVVKNWVETEKFAAQYDPELSEHDRKIQLNRLNRAETENVSGGHFHAWKNLHGAVRSKMAQKIAAAGLLVGMSVSLVGCFANSNPNDQPVVPTNTPSSYGMVVGSGEKVETPTGAYEKITIDKTSPIYEYNNGDTHPSAMTDAGFTEEDGKASQKFVADYMVKEFVDSSALEGGDAAYQQWHAVTAKSYYADNVYQEIQKGEAPVVLGNYGGTNSLPPTFIHDGSPREKSLDMNIVGFRPWDNAAGLKGVKYSVNYNAEYRVDDANAAQFVSSHLGISKEDFLKSNQSKDNLRDGTGENVFKASGKANIVVSKDSSGSWKIIGFQSETNFDTSDFTQNFNQ